MKKFFFFAAAVIMMAAGCQKQELNPVTDGDTTVTFTVSTGEIATKAIADGTNIDVLYWEIYQDLNEDPLGEGKVKDTDANKEFTVELKLLADQEYNIVFWAQVDREQGKEHYDVSDLRSVKIKTYDDEMANDETRAAFFAVHNFSTENGVAIKEDVILRRPFSQLNLGATTLETSLNLVNNGQLEVKTTQVVVTNIATSFNTVAGEGEGEQAVTFKHAETPVDYTQQLLTVNGEKYHWLGMNYLIVNGEADNVVVDIEVETSVGKVNHTVSNVPIKENYRTNILGNLLTTGAEFTVIIDEKFDGEYYGPDFLKTPAYNEQTKTWNVTEKYELLWVADQVNNKANTFKGETVQITSDIDLAGMNWTPIASTGLFEGIFEGASMTKSGAGYPTIKNLTVATEGRAYAGLFASCRGTIRNINLANVNITGHYKAGAISGDGLCAKIENCHVDGAVIVSTPYNNDDANHVGGIVGYLSAEPTAYVKNCSVKNAEIKAYRDAGGIAGMANGASVVTGNSVENVTVVADQTSQYKEVKAPNAGAVVGRIHEKATVAENTLGENVEVYVLVNTAEGLQNVLLNKNVNAGTTEVRLAAGIAGNVTVDQQEGKNIVINGDGNKYDGTITIDGNARYNGAETVLIKNVNFATEADALNFVEMNSTDGTVRYAHNVTIDGCTFEGGADVVAAKFRQCYNITFKNSEVKSGHSLAQLYGCTGVSIENVKVNADRGVSLGTSTGCSVTNSEFVVGSYGLRADNTTATLAIDNTKITAKLPVVVRKLTSGKYTIDFTGANTLTAPGYQVVFTNGDDEGTFVAPTGTFEITGAEDFLVFPNNDGKTFAYRSEDFTAALNNKEPHIVLLPGAYEGVFAIKSSTGTVIESKGGAVVDCINLNGSDNVTLKNIAFDAAGAQGAYDGKGNRKQYANVISGGAAKNGSGTRGLEIVGCSFTGKFANGGVAIAFTDQSRTSGQSGEITIKDCTFATEGGYYDIYCFYSGYGELNIEGNTFNSDVLGLPIYLGRYQSSTPVVVKGNAFNKCADFAAAAYIQAHSSSYTVSFDESGNTFAE